MRHPSARRALIAAVVIAAMGTFGLASAQVRYRQSFTEEDVQSILRELRTEDPRSYLVRLPVFRSGKVVGAATYGALPMTEVRRVASLLDVQLNENGNVIAAKGCDSSMQPAAAHGQDLGDRLEDILVGIDTSQYQLLR